MQDCRALVMPSRTPEPFGLVAAEASLSGLPVILSEQSLLSKDFSEHNLGFRCNTETPAKIATVLADVAALPADQVKAMSERAHAGTAGIAMVPDDWIEHLIALYQGGKTHDAAA